MLVSIKPVLTGNAVKQKHRVAGGIGPLSLVSTGALESVAGAEYLHLPLRLVTETGLLLSLFVYHLRVIV